MSSNLFKQVISDHSLRRKCLGIGANYYTQALKKNPTKVKLPQYPPIFSKPLSALLPKGESFTIPATSGDKDVWHEVELGIMLKRGGKDIKVGDWKEYIGCYFLVIDYTDKAMQNAAKEAGEPWLLAKGQEGFLCLSDSVPFEEVGDPHDIDLELRLNQEVKQSDNTGNMSIKIFDQLAYVSKYMEMHPGDILMTGTPEGSGPVQEGDLLQASMSYQGKVLATIEDTIQRGK